MDNDVMDNKVQGYTAFSPSDPTKKGLLYLTKEAAQIHQSNMNNVMLPKWDDGKTWNKEYWNNEKPQPWEVYEVVLGNRIC